MRIVADAFWTSSSEWSDGSTSTFMAGEPWASQVQTQPGRITTSSWPEDDPEPDFSDYLPNVYRYFVFDILKDELLAELNMTDVTFGHKLSAVGDFSGTVTAIEAQADIDLYWATMPTKVALYVLRNEQAVWGGIIWNRTYDATTKQLQISAGTWESYLFKRYIWHSFTMDKDVDQWAVVRRLLARMRNDFSGSYTTADNVVPVPGSSAVDIYSRTTVFSGHTQDTQTFDRGEMRSFGDAITEYANNINGFEWNFEYTYNATAGRFRRRIAFRPAPPALLPKGSPEPPFDEEHRPGIDTYLFEWPGNIMQLSLEEDGDNACTRQFIVGGFSESLDTDYKPIGSWNNKKYMDAGFPLIENVESSKYPHVSNQARLNNLASIHGRESAPPLKKWTIVVNGSMDPIVGTYKVGDWCRLAINDEFIQQGLTVEGVNVNGGLVKRIIGVSVNVPSGPQLPETVTLELEDNVVVS